MSQTYFSELLPVLAERAKLAAISRLGFANIPLRRHLAEVFDRPYGERGAFLADPAFEAVFGWRQSEKCMADLAGNLLTPALVNAMDQPPKDLTQDYRFARNQSAYQHQLEAWRILGNVEPQSLVVASGTGSGKTECFMVPILDSLVRARDERQGKLVGVRALFLYPLNALINSQRERLRAWTHAFGEDIRFCLFNGNTPEKTPAHNQREQPSEVLDRESLRKAPPPILVTNATMLEYMLVRTADKPILDQSQGKLEWVVLDEAHTYVGSQAAEAALLIRRVLLAFGVKPEQVRFVATSATIGDPEGEAGQKLRQFLAEVAGVSLGRVHLVAGQRAVSALPTSKSGSTATLDELFKIDEEDETSARRYDALVEHAVARQLRDLFVGDPDKPPVARLSDVCGKLFGSQQPFSRSQQLQALRWLDLLSGTRDNTGDNRRSGESFLPLRAHLFHQTLSGLWACADKACTEKPGTTLDAPEWPFGQVYFDPRKHCDCGSPVYEIVACDDCGTVHLLAGVSQGLLAHLQPQAALDEFELETESGESEDESETEEDEPAARSRQTRVLIVNRVLPGVGSLDIDRTARMLTEQGDNTLRVEAHEDGGVGLLCPACGGQESPKRKQFQSSRLGAPFLLGSILPTLLEYAPDIDKPADHPCRGRRLLSFNDSRQGTARIAAKLQQDAERNRVRGLVYHLSLQLGRSQASTQAENLAGELNTLEQIPAAQRNAALDKLISDKRSNLARLTQPVPVFFNDLAQQLANQGRDFNTMLEHYRRHAPGTFGEASGPVELARMFLVREFGRRPKRLNNLESMGMVAVRYPALDAVQQVPAEVTQAAGFTLDEWKAFLKLSLDFYVRAGGALSFPPSWRNWLGVPFPQTQLVPRDAKDKARSQRYWPRAKRSGLRSTLVRLLAYVMKAEIETAYGEDRVDAVLLAAWDTLFSLGLLQQSGDGRVLPLEKLAFSPISEAWICPVTRRFLDTTLRGITPYLPEKATNTTAQCRKLNIPLYFAPFAGVTDDLERIRLGREWLTQETKINKLRDEGYWPAVNDRVIELAPYFTAAEHSAQQDSKTLGRYEDAFKTGDLNLLSCSTTMEMGIDIGGISLVAMNNVPPHPANYLQRAGRAGRRREARSLAMTLCKSNPLDQAVFNNTRWAFDSALPAPRVSLDSPIIVQRHIHSLLLSRFLAATLAGSKEEQTKLNCGWFFLDERSIATRYTEWCLSFSADTTTVLGESLKQLVRHSVFEGKPLEHLTGDAARAMDELIRGWLLEWAQLKKEANDIEKSGKSSPAFKAVELHQKRLSGEYLLRELATRGYLPAYGFPTHIAAFDNLTLGQSRRAQAESGREDNRYRRRELASRDLTTALREYAPGSEVVMDGLVYRSAGVTLNWHIPADQYEAQEIQDIRHVWRCTHCGASGSSRSLTEANHCDACGAGIDAANIRQFIEPAGFAVDFYKEPSNDISTQHFVPVEAPWIDARGDWLPLPNPILGRFRATARGHVFHQSRGIHGEGYALCLECGRAEPMLDVDTRPAVFMKPHPKLRRAKVDAPFCSGSDNDWKIKYGITLGHETWTDILELQIKTETGVWLNDDIEAMTLAVALRDSLAELIGVQATELGCDTKPAISESGGHCRSILIFDRFEAGYATSTERYLPELFKAAHKKLICPAECDSACPHCVLDFDQRFNADKLDRRAALRVLTEVWLNSLKLPDEFAYFGKGSRPEYRRLPEAIRQALVQTNTTRIRLFAAGSPADWDIGPSPLRKLAYSLSGQGNEVEIVVPDQALTMMDDSNRYLLASLADHPKVTIRTSDATEHCGQGWLLAETLGGSSSVRWAIGKKTETDFGPGWGVTDEPLIMVADAVSSSLNGATLDATTIRPRPTDNGDRETQIHRELNGELQGFGTRFWTYLADQHAATKTLLTNQNDDVTALVYRDRYLFTPLSVALLAEVVCGLRQIIGQGRWAAPAVQVVTTNRRSAGENKSRKNLWSDWLDMSVRDQVLAATLHYQGVDAVVQLADNASTGHGRLLEIKWSSGKTLTVRLDQGVSYWRSAHSNTRQDNDLNLNSETIESQAKHLAELAINIEGAQLPTQIFLKVR